MLVEMPDAAGPTRLRPRFELFWYSEFVLDLQSAFASCASPMSGLETLDARVSPVELWFLNLHTTCIVAVLQKWYKGFTFACYHAIIGPLSQALCKKIVKALLPAPRPVAIVQVIVIRSHRGLICRFHRPIFSSAAGLLRCACALRPQAFCFARLRPQEYNQGA